MCVCTGVQGGAADDQVGSCACGRPEGLALTRKCWQAATGSRRMIAEKALELDLRLSRLAGKGGKESATSHPHQLYGYRGPEAHLLDRRLADAAHVPPPEHAVLGEHLQGGGSRR